MTPFRQLRRDLAWKPIDSGSYKWTAAGPGVILLMTLLVVGTVLLADHQSLANLKARVHEEHRLKMNSCRDHLQNYLDSIYSTLLFISLDDDVRAHRRNSYKYLKRLYEHELSEGMLREILVTHEGFLGTNRPFMEFTRDGRAPPSAQPPERREYQVVVEHLRLFAAKPRLKASLSTEIDLCQTNFQASSRGLVYSLPIYSNRILRGGVSAVLETAKLQSLLHRGLRGEVAFLLPPNGDFLGLPNSRVRAELQSQIPLANRAAFFKGAPQSFSVGSSIAIWTSVEVAPAQKWWIVYLYGKDDYLQSMAFNHSLGRAALVGSLTITGVALALLMRVLGRRLNEHAAQFKQRMEMEREIQEASEREQRRIGEVMHEDLCQRLNGLEAASRMLQKRLAPADSIESGIAGEISRELHSSLTRFRQIADELQPVPLFEDGFFAAIQLLAAHAESRHGLKCSLEGSKTEQKLDPAFATNLFRITQEALNNVVKHAAATRVTICFSESGGGGSLTITDDGKGMPEVVERGEGMGLRIMKYRCDLIGAELQVGPASGGGTQVKASWSQPFPFNRVPERSSAPRVAPARNLVPQATNGHARTQRRRAERSVT